MLHQQQGGGTIQPLQGAESVAGVVAGADRARRSRSSPSWAAFRRRARAGAPLRTVAPHAILRLLAVLRSDQALVIGWRAASSCGPVEIVFALNGTPAVPRYMFEPACRDRDVAAVGLGLVGCRSCPSLIHIPRLAGTVARRRAFLVPGLHSRRPRPSTRTSSREGPHAPSSTNCRGSSRRSRAAPAARYVRRPGDRHRVRLADGWLTHMNDRPVGLPGRSRSCIAQQPIVLFTALHDGWAAWPGTRSLDARLRQRMKSVWTSPNNEPPSGIQLPMNHTPPISQRKPIRPAPSRAYGLSSSASGTDTRISAACADG